MFGEQAIVPIRPTYRVRVKKLIFRLVALTCITFAVWAGVSRLGEYIGAKDHYATQVVVVRHGDTLWGIATEYGPQGWDPRKTVEVIRELNGLTSSDVGRLRPGQELQIPGY